jgi:RNA polymerase sigma-70 factor, ECF subfamily
VRTGSHGKHHLGVSFDSSSDAELFVGIGERADRARARVEAVADVSDSPTDEPSPAEHAEHEWVRSRVHSAVEALPPLERSLIELAYWSDLSQSQIAARLGMPLGTVKTGTRRALARLATLLERESQLAD